MQGKTPDAQTKYYFPLVFLRNSVPQSPNFPVANASAHEAVLQRVTEMFKLNFPYTTVYPALGNLDVLHPRILEASESSSAFGKTREADHYGSRGHKKRRKWYGNGMRGDHHETTTACKYTTNSSILYTLIITRGSAKRAGIGLQLRKQSWNAVAFFLALTSREFLFERLFEFTPGWLRNSRLEKKQLLLASSRERDVSLREFRTNCAKASASPPVATAAGSGL